MLVYCIQTAEDVKLLVWPGSTITLVFLSRHVAVAVLGMPEWGKAMEGSMEADGAQLTTDKPAPAIIAMQ